MARLSDAERKRQSRANPETAAHERERNRIYERTRRTPRPGDRHKYRRTSAGPA